MIPMPSIVMSEPFKEKISLGQWDTESLSRLLRETKDLEPGQRVSILSEAMVGIPYDDKTLIGDANTAEVLVIELARVDCFTFVDYLEAMRLSSNFEEFKNNLIAVRYKGAKIHFLHRRHFFSDWVSDGLSSVFDATETIGGSKTKKVKKILNLKKDRSKYLTGLPPVERTISYIPSSALDRHLLSRLKTGDYIGIYTRRQGLDVSHIGLFIRDRGGREIFRHASSLKAKVVDEDFMQYVSKRAGIVVIRPK